MTKISAIAVFYCTSFLSKLIVTKFNIFTASEYIFEKQILNSKRNLFHMVDKGHNIQEVSKKAASS